MVEMFPGRFNYLGLMHDNLIFAGTTYQDPLPKDKILPIVQVEELYANDNFRSILSQANRLRS